MNITNHLIQRKLLEEKESIISFIIHGQGVFIFSVNDAKSCKLKFHDSTKENAIEVELDTKGFTIKQVKKYENYSQGGGKGLEILRISEEPSVPPKKDKVKILKDPNNKKGLSSKKGAYYWISLDSQNRRIYAGIGEPRLETMVYQYRYKSVSKQTKLFLESLVETHLFDGNIQPIRFLRDPISQNIPMLVKPTDQLTMCDIASSKYLPKANLSLVSQKLYDCISGKNFCLDDADFPDFTAAIERSIATPGLWCNKTLENKSKEFNKDKPNLLETYLRITLGQNNGESPGIPYVLEIWPKGHFSPIHNHGGSSAIIRVLHGKIDVHLYPYLCEEKPEKSVDPFSTAFLEKDDITWISPTLNQIHQLKNPETNATSCITIQCYMYDDENTTHYDYFDYLDEDGHTQQYEPDSDMDYINFRERMKEEWAQVCAKTKLDA